MAFDANRRMNVRLFDRLREHFDLIVLGAPSADSEYGEEYITFNIMYPNSFEDNDDNDDDGKLACTYDALAGAIIGFANKDKVLVIRSGTESGFGISETDYSYIRVRLHTLADRSELVKGRKEAP